MRKLYENFNNFHFQKRFASTEIILRNMLSKLEFSYDAIFGINLLSPLSLLPPLFYLSRQPQYFRGPQGFNFASKRSIFGIEVSPFKFYGSHKFNTRQDQIKTHLSEKFQKLKMTLWKKAHCLHLRYGSVNQPAWTTTWKTRRKATKQRKIKQHISRFLEI